MTKRRLVAIRRKDVLDAARAYARARIALSRVGTLRSPLTCSQAKACSAEQMAMMAYCGAAMRLADADALPRDWEGK